MKKEASGIAFVDYLNGKILLGKRSAASSEPNRWSVFGGKVEQGETNEEGARREVLEETGIDYDGNLTNIHSKNKFTYYLALIDNYKNFQITLNNEHTAYQWFDLIDFFNAKDLHRELETDKFVLIKKIMDAVKSK